jgi:uncharacterized membrane protein (DUF106 family)
MSGTEKRRMKVKKDKKKKKKYMGTSNFMQKNHFDPYAFQFLFSVPLFFKFQFQSKTLFLFYFIVFNLRNERKNYYISMVKKKNLN